MANEIYLDGVRVPLASSYKLKDELNYKKNTSLQGIDTYDITYRKRQWEISWTYIKTETDFALVKQFWLDQIASNTMPLMDIIDEGISGVKVFIDIGIMNRKLNNTLQEGFSITLTECEAV